MVECGLISPAALATLKVVCHDCWGALRRQKGHGVLGYSTGYCNRGPGHRDAALHILVGECMGIGYHGDSTSSRVQGCRLQVITSG